MVAGQSAGCFGALYFGGTHVVWQPAAAAYSPWVTFVTCPAAAAAATSWMGVYSPIPHAPRDTQPSAKETYGGLTQPDRVLAKA